MLFCKLILCGAVMKVAEHHYPPVAFLESKLPVDVGLEETRYTDFNVYLL